MQGETFSVEGRRLEVNPVEGHHGVVELVEVVYDRATMVVAKWRDGMITSGAFCGGSSREVASAQARQRAMVSGLNLRARWARTSEAAE